MIIIGGMLLRFLEPKEDVRLIQLELWPKIIATLILLFGLIFLVVGIGNAI